MRFVDANIFLYHISDDPRYGVKASKILERIEKGEQAATSTLVISQVCSYLKWKKKPNVIPTFLLFLRSLPSLSKIDTIFEDFIGAGELSLEHRLGWKLWDDLVISMQMKRLNVTEIYSNDSDFDSVPGVRKVF